MNKNSELFSTEDLKVGENEYLNVKVIDDSITISKELIELKDIESVKLYRKNGDDEKLKGMFT